MLHGLPPRRALFSATVSLTLGAPVHGHGADAILRSEENAVVHAEDAFGVAVGREQLGLYESRDVRGFSPLAAGNARIEGLYFDPAGEPGALVQSATTIRVGMAARGHPFIAPTGIVDYGLRRPGAPAASLVAAADSLGSGSIEATASLPLRHETLALGIGAQLGRAYFGDGAAETSAAHALLLQARPAPGLEIAGFWSREDYRDGRPGPLYLADEGLPRFGAARHIGGPAWAKAALVSGTTGLIATADVATDWHLSFGTFRSHRSARAGFTILRTELAAAGGFRQRLVADPPQRTVATSGEARLSRVFIGGGLEHAFHLALRTRHRVQDYGGSVAADLGRYPRADPPRPALAFGTRARDTVDQRSIGVAYQARWRDRAELGISVLRTRYEKRSRQPGAAPGVGSADPLLLSAMGVVRVAEGVQLYSSFARGLEESEPAPDVAANRGAPVPALRTRQLDGGVRLQATPAIGLVGTVFELQKPYFSLDPADRYVRLGTIRNRGLELSLAGALTPRLSLVVGTLLQRPRVSGPAVEQGLAARRPVGLTSRISTVDIDWRVPGLDALSLDLALASRSAEPSTADNRIVIPARTTFDLGGRYRLRIGGQRAVLRLAVANLFDRRGHVAEGPGAYTPLTGRTLSGYLTVDF